MTERTANRVVLDSHAVLVFLENGPGADKVRQALTDGESWMTLVNLGEVTYVIERKYGSHTADRIFTQFLANDGDGGREAIQWLPIDENLVRLAASLKAGGGLAYADCFAAAAAGILGCPVLTGDREFERAERAGISVRWL